MAYINNGYKRAESITVLKYINGIPQSPIKYWIINAFDIYSPISSYTYQTLSDVDFINRRDAFILYVSSIEIGIIISKDQFEVYDTTTCSITTTTTTIPPECDLIVSVILV